jgi:hypothetical protein
MVGLQHPKHRAHGNSKVAPAEAEVGRKDAYAVAVSIFAVPGSMPGGEEPERRA